MKELIEFLARSIVDDPDAVQVEEEQEGDRIVYHLYVAEQDMVFSANWICHDSAVGVQGILLATGKDIQRGRVVGNMLISGSTATVDMLILTDTTANSGIVAFNLIGHHDTAGEVLVDADGMRQFENRGAATDTSSGYVLPAIDS